MTPTRRVHRWVQGVFLLAVALTIATNLWNSYKYDSFSSSIEMTPVLPDTSIRSKATSTRMSNGAKRLFLGILTKRKPDARLRNAIRKTYLSFHQQPATSTYVQYSNITEICPYYLYEQLIHNSTHHLEYSMRCPIVYAFVVQGAPKAKQQFTLEPDLLQVQPPTTPSSSSYHSVQHFLDYFLQKQSQSATTTTRRIDYLAVTHSRVVLFPTILWKSEVFSSTTNHAVLMKDYWMLSMDALPHISSYLETVAESNINAQEHPLMDDHISNWMESEQQQFLSLPSGVQPLQEHKYNYLDFVQIWDEYKDQFVIYEDPNEAIMVQDNPKVVDTLGTCRSGPRVLLGIFTMQSEKERRRRMAIRESYLNYYRDLSAKTYADNPATSPTYHRICSLWDLLEERRSVTNLAQNKSLLQEYQLAYVFVLGGNPNGPKELVAGTESALLRLPPPNNATEPDMLYLNIQENMKEGKSQTFLKYATLVVDEFVYFDYIAKTVSCPHWTHSFLVCYLLDFSRSHQIQSNLTQFNHLQDSDTLIIPQNFLETNINKLPRFPDNVRVYGGSPRVKEEYGHLTGPIYNQGLLYWMSVDLARYVVSTACNREALKVWSEDKSVGNFVHSHPLPLRHHKIVQSPRSYHHPLKDIQEFRDHWKGYKP